MQESRHHTTWSCALFTATFGYIVFCTFWVTLGFLYYFVSICLDMLMWWILMPDNFDFLLGVSQWMKKSGVQWIIPYPNSGALLCREGERWLFCRYAVSLALFACLVCSGVWTCAVCMAVGCRDQWRLLWTSDVVIVGLPDGPAASHRNVATAVSCWNFPSTSAWPARRVSGIYQAYQQYFQQVSLTFVDLRSVVVTDADTEIQKYLQ